jgi:hypothetical protein
MKRIEIAGTKEGWKALFISPFSPGRTTIFSKRT